MEAFIPYFVGVNLLLLLQAVYYRLFLARQPRFMWNRVYLLGGMVAALLLPLLRLEIVSIPLPDPVFTAILPEIVMGTSQSPSPAPAPAAPGLTAFELGLAVYGIGVVVTLAVLLWRNIFIISLIWKGEKTRHKGYTLVDTSKDIGPASFFRFIFWNEGRGLDPQSAAVAMAHERCHSRQLHSLDLMGVEILKALCWINPAIYLLRKDLRQTHEYLADQAALEVAGLDGIKRLLLMRQLGAPHLAIANYFHSHIKARMIMLTGNQKRKTLAHYLLFVPLAGLMAACTSFAHPSESSSAYIAADSPTVAVKGGDSVRFQGEAENYPGFFHLEDVFVRAELPLGSGSPEAKGMVCLGEQPRLLNLDTAHVRMEGEPRLLNRDRIVKLIGYPKKPEDQKIKVHLADVPKDAEEDKLTGKVVVKVLVDETGHVIRHLYLQESHALLRDAVEAHVRDLLFMPGMKEGKAEKWWVIVPFSFGMGDGC